MAGIALDLNDHTSVVHFAKDVRSRFPEPNMLIANAGISRAENINADMWDVSHAQAIVETNILGVLRVTAAGLPILKSPRAMPLASYVAQIMQFLERDEFTNGEILLERDHPRRGTLRRDESWVEPRECSRCCLKSVHQ
jgi:uncharacterized oxidoreductase